MKVFNTVLSVILLVAVAFLFYKTYEKPAGPGKKKEVSESEMKENLEGQDFSGVRIAYINSDSLVEKYDYHKELKAKLEKKAKALEADLASKSETFQENVKILQQQAGSLSQEELQAAQLDLQQVQQQLMQYSDQKTQELALEEQELNKLIKDDVESILEDIKKEYGLDFILSYDPQSILLSANENYNITDIVAQRLNEKFKKNREQSKSGEE